MAAQLQELLPGLGAVEARNLLDAAGGRVDTAMNLYFEMQGASSGQTGGHRLGGTSAFRRRAADAGGGAAPPPAAPPDLPAASVAAPAAAPAAAHTDPAAAAAAASSDAAGAALVPSSYRRRPDAAPAAARGAGPAAAGELQLHVDIDGAKHAVEVAPEARVRDVRSLLRGLLGARRLSYGGEVLPEDTVFAEAGVGAEAQLVAVASPITTRDIVADAVGAGGGCGGYGGGDGGESAGVVLPAGTPPGARVHATVGAGGTAGAVGAGGMAPGDGGGASFAAAHGSAAPAASAGGGSGGSEHSDLATARPGRAGGDGPGGAAGGAGEMPRRHARAPGGTGRVAAPRPFPVTVAARAGQLRAGVGHSRHQVGANGQDGFVVFGGLGGGWSFRRAGDAGPEPPPPDPAGEVVLTEPGAYELVLDFDPAGV